MPKKHKLKGKKKGKRLDENPWYPELAMSWGKNPYEKEDSGEIY